MAKDRVEVYTQLYRTGTETVKTAAESVPEDKRLHQIAEGKGHPLWQMGHLAFAHDRIINQIFLGGESVVPDEYTGMFAPELMKGNAPTGNAADYPSWDEVLENYDKASANTIELIEGLSDEELPGGLKGEAAQRTKDYFGSLERALMMMGLHAAHHRGQIGLLSAL